MTGRSLDCYDAPNYWDVAFSDETPFEADFIDAVVSRYVPRTARPPRILEIGCGGGRQVVELAKRGYDVTAFDLNESCVVWTQRQLQRRKLNADVFRDDMTLFRIQRPVNLAHCLVNTFRHLLTEQSARQHLQCVANSLTPGGIYLLGFHLLPPDASEEDSERWTVHHRGTRVTTTIRVLNFSRRKRLETVRFSLKVTSPKRVLRLSTDHQLRIYRADQFRSLLRSVPSLRLLDVFDFCYDINEPLALNDDLGDAVFVLQKQ